MARTPTPVFLVFSDRWYTTLHQFERSSLAQLTDQALDMLGKFQVGRLGGDGRTVRLNPTGVQLNYLFGKCLTYRLTYFFFIFQFLNL